MQTSFLMQKIHAGFPSPAEDYLEPPIDLHQHLIHNVSATFLGRVVGDCMRESGFFPNDIVVVDRSIPVDSGQVIVACLNQSFILRKIELKPVGCTLLAADEQCPAIVVGEADDFMVWGVVTGVVRKFM